METFLAAISDNNLVLLIISCVIFVLALALASRKLLSFVFTLIILFFVIVSGVAIANNAIVRDYMKKTFNVDPAEYSLEGDSRIESLKERVWGIFEQLVDTLSNTKQLSPQSERSLRELLKYLDVQRNRIQAYLDDGELPDDGNGLIIAPPYNEFQKG